MAVKKETPVLLKKDYWDLDGIRLRAGEVVHLTVDEAKALLKEGKAERADPLPGE